MTKSKTTVDRDIIPKIAKVLKKHKEIEFAYLYGSFARGLQDRRSDIDIAVYLSKLPHKPLYQAALALELEKTTKSGREIDVRMLNERSLRFCHQVLGGKLIFTRDPRATVAFQERVTVEYLDMKPHWDEYDRARERRLGV